MLRILIMAPFYPAVGGIATWANELVEKEDENIAFAKLNEANLSKYRKFFLYDIYRCFKIWRELVWNLRYNDIDIVHINIPANILSMLRELLSISYVHKFKKKAIVHFHCTLPTIICSKIQYLIFKWICKKSDGIITLNSFSYDYEKKINENVANIPNFTTSKMISIGEQRVIYERASTVLYVGSIIETKGCIDLIEVAKHFPDMEFRMVGKVGININELDIPKNVTFTGVKSGDELAKEYHNADIFAFLSHMPAEGFSVSLTEAMATGLPCVVTDWAANKDMVEDSGGIVTKPNDVSEMVDAFKKIQNYELRKKMSKWNVAKVKNFYTLPIIFAKISSFYVNIQNKV